jgi:hypothetical protein
MKSAYSWKPNSQIPVDAEKAGQHIELLQQRRGGQVTPKDILEDARSNKSPLHDAFEWSDDKAAEQFRMQQARHILQSIIIEVKIKHGKPATPMRAFVNVTKRGESTYVGLQTAMSDKELRAQVIDRAWSELVSWRDRYQEYQELAKMVGAIDHETRFRKAA